ncbi:GPI-anchored protein LLG1-like [Dioscorea cayenensis subsp. rotundata]|uniref:GPI-anchored protein LLG1-like n=1 Tax=Dioscorea cayennensis subsp. rotundata TaxID=55577 RepID=A0AB40CQJ1_DIOCR|nr:GPI-anchored protein LLG1-like [Dioscorea cayenensis subsp. rotundata]
MNYYYYFFFFVFGLQACLLLVVASSSSSSNIFISGDVLKDQRYAGRNLLQTKRKCPLSFEFANYTILTSKCKGPDYPKKQCCSALGDFACPYAKYINDISSECSSDMFSYIDQHSGYPRGLFSSECRRRHTLPR